MSKNRVVEAVVLGSLLCIGLYLLGSVLGASLIRFKEYERSVTVKGLSVREVPADIAIWPISFVSVGNELEEVYRDLESKTQLVGAFLSERGFDESDVTVGIPALNDMQARGHFDPNKMKFRYSATQTMTVYSDDPDAVRAATADLIELGKSGIALSQHGYNEKIQYLFSGLNEIKPAMVEEATRKAREVAEKFAQDSASVLGKIKQARQGQFSINDRDSNNPHMKRVRVVNTVEYYLSD
jgi:hypothetical protein